MADVTVNLPGLGHCEGESPIVVLGPNGSGKTRLAQKIASTNQVSAVSAQRRTWVDDNLPVQEEEQLLVNTRNQQNVWRNQAWRPVEDINFLLSRLVQDHTNILTRRNEEAAEAGSQMDPVTDTKLIRLQRLWAILFPKRKLEIGGFFPKAKRLDADGMPTYQLREMSDGERTVLYMAARVMTTEQSIVLVDEPELHMHGKLAVQFWDEAERLRPDCRFIYVTHDLNFAMSRRSAMVLMARSGDEAQVVPVPEDLPASIVKDILGAATLPFFAKRIVFYEGEAGKGFASEFLETWFDDVETFAIPAGDRDSVCAAVGGLRTVGITGAEVIGLVDRDHSPEAVLDHLTAGVTVLAVHEIESVLCNEDVVTALAVHLGRDGSAALEDFRRRVQAAFVGRTLSSVVAQRVRARTGDLLDGAFSGEQIVDDLSLTTENHREALSRLDLPARVAEIFKEESERVARALEGADERMLVTLPGKHLLSLLAAVLGQSNTSVLTTHVVKSLGRRHLESDEALRSLGETLESALLKYLPPRCVETGTET